MDGRGMEFIDPALDDSVSGCKLLRCMGIGLLCVQEKQEDRPSMLEVLSMLKNEIEPNMAPKKPAFSIRADRPDAEQTSCSCPQYTHSSCVDSTISEVEPR
uniref:Receptor protein serine/threonine kinase n=2 Tax=Opuntia streptacantha TaxID=393608 RepID=A0A7C9ANY9_OPUST